MKICFFKMTKCLDAVKNIFVFTFFSPLQYNADPTMLDEDGRFPIDYAQQNTKPILSKYMESKGKQKQRRKRRRKMKINGE